MEINQTISQKQMLSLVQHQSLKILTMNNCELYEFVHNEQTENPILELNDVKESYDAILSVGKWLHSTDTYSRATLQEQVVEKVSQSKESMKDFLIAQINQNTFTERQIRTIEFIVYSLNGFGFLEIPPLEIAYLTKRSLLEIQYAIEQVQALEPAGIAANGLSQCLILQLERMGNFDPVLVSLIKYHLEEIADGHVHKVAKALSITSTKVREYMALIRQLNPRPANGFSQNPTQYIVPDVLFLLDEDGWQIHINDQWTGSIQIGSLYQSTKKFADCTPDVQEYIIKRIMRAKMLLSSIEKRRDTLQKIAQFILVHQQNFVDGTGAISSLHIKEVAVALNVNSSTISRAIKGKYIQCPHGTYAMRSFFSVSDSTISTGREEIKKLIKEILIDENATTPLSDTAIAQKLSMKNITISRRTVSKYRAELGILATLQRKR